MAMSAAWKYDAVVSFDLGWSEANRVRTAAAWCLEGGVPQWTPPDEEVEIITFLERFKGTHTLVLLDIPIYGTEGLSKQRPWRPLDRRLQSLGVPLLPSYKAGDYGMRLAETIMGRFPTIHVVESYPYAVLRFIWAIKLNNADLGSRLLPLVNVHSWWKDWPPKYKRARTKGERVQCMQQVLDKLILFMRIDGLEQLAPDELMNTSLLGNLTDVYDALLALVVGMKMAEGSPWVLEAKAGGPSMIPILTDSNLREKWVENGKRISGKSRSRIEATQPIARNLEIKARLHEFEEARAVAASLVEEPPILLHQTDTYFYVPQGRLKLREEDNGSELVFYVRADTFVQKISEYQKVQINNSVRLKKLLSNALGIVTVVKKTRTVFQYGSVRIHLDEVDGLGRFLELEAAVSPTHPEKDAESLIAQLMAHFSISVDDLIDVSYCDMCST